MSHLTSKHFLHAKFVLLSTLVVFCIFGGITGNSSSQAFAHVDESDVKYFSQSDKTIVHSHVSIFESFDIYGTLYDDNSNGNSNGHNNDNSQSDAKTNPLTTTSKHTMVFINDGDYSLSQQQLDYTVEYVTDQIQDNALLLTRNFIKSFDISSIASNIVSPLAYAATDNIQPSLSSENTIPWSDDVIQWSDDIYYFFTESFTEIGDIRINSDGTISASLVSTLVLASLLPVSFVVFVGRYNVSFNALEKNIYISRNNTLKKSLTMFFVIILLSSSVPLLNFSNPSAMFGETEMLPEAYAQVDSTPPEFSSSSLSNRTGVFDITFDEIINHSTINSTAIHIRENNSTGGITLSASELVTTTNSDTISFTLSTAHLNLVNALNTPTLYIDASAVQDISGNNFAGPVFNVISFVDSFSVGDQESIPRGMAFSPNGTKMFVVGPTTDSVYEYTLSTPFNVTSASYTGDSFLIGDQVASSTGLAFSPDGTKMFVLDFGGGVVAAYNLTIPFNVTSASFTGNLFSVADHDPSPLGMAFSPDGTKMFVTGTSSDNATAYNLTIPFNVTSASFVDSFSLKDVELTPYDLAFSPDGTKMFVLGNGLGGDNNVHKYDLSVPFDVTSASYTDGDSFSVDDENGDTQSLAFSPDGTKMFVLGYNSLSVHEYDLSTAFNITLNSIDSTFGNNVGFDDTTPWIEDLSFQYRRVFTIDADNVPGSSNLADFAVMISLNATQGFGTIMQSHINNDGSDLRFADNLGNLLSYEIEQYDEDINQMLVWVKSNSTGISSSIDTSIYMYYGNSAATSTADSASVWNNGYEAVYHMNGTATGSNTVRDSTSNANHGNIVGTISLGSAGGKLGTAIDFPGTATNRVNIGANTFPTGTSNRTISAWIETDSITGGHAYSVSYGSAVINQAMFLGQNSQTLAAGGFGNDLSQNNFWTVNNYQLVTLTFNGTITNLYVGGIPVISDAKPWVTGDTDTAYIGSQINGVEFWDGHIDEVRISNQVLSADWLRTEFNNQNSPSTFYDISDEIKIGTIFDTVTLADTVIKISYIQLTESLSLSDSAGIMSNNMVQPTESLSLSDSAGIMSNNMVQPTESLSLSDTAIGTLSYNEIQLTESLSLSDGMRLIDTTPPEFSNATLNEGTGVFDITFSEIINHTTVTPTAIHIRENNTSTSSLILSISEYTTTTNSDTISFTLNSTQLDLVNALNTPVLYMYTAAVQDIRGNNFVGSAFDVTTASFVGSFLVADQEASPRGLAFSPNGTKMFVVSAANDNVNVYDLTTAFDVTTANFTGNFFSVNNEEADPFGLAFSPNGTKMFVLGVNVGNLTAYDLTVPFDVTTASFVDYFSVNTRVSGPTGLAFSPDGAKMFVVGLTSDSVHEYALSTAFNVTSASFGNSFSVRSQEANPTGLAFSPDGAKMFVVGFNGGNVTAYNLSTAFDVTSASFVDSFSVNNEDRIPQGLVFSPDGTKMFVTGSSNDRVYEYELSTAFNITIIDTTPPEFSNATLNESTSVFKITFNEIINHVAIIPTAIHIRESNSTGGITLSTSELDTTANSDTISFTLNSTHLDLVNVLDTPTLYIDTAAVQDISGNNFVGSIFNITIIDIPPEFSSSALNVITGVFKITFNEIINHVAIIPTAIHIRENNTSTGGITLSTSEYTTTANSDTISFTLNSTHLDLVNVLDTPTLYIDTAAVQDIRGNNFVGSAFDVTTASFVGSFLLDPQMASPTGLTFSPDGTKMFVVSLRNGNVNGYTLTVPFDVTTASFVDSFSVSNEDRIPQGLVFSPDGTKMFVVGESSDNVNEYDLTVPFNVTTANFTDNFFSVNAEESFPTDLTFSPNGTKMFVVGENSNNVNEYDLTVPFNVTTANFTGNFFSVAVQDVFPSGLTFSPDGTKMFVVGKSSDNVNEYDLTVPFDVTTASFVDYFSVAVQDVFPSGLTFSPDGAKMFVVGTDNYNVNEYDLTTAFNIALIVNIEVSSIESLSLSDSIGIMSNNMVQLTEPLSLTDAAGIMSNNMVQLTEPLSLSDTAGISVMSNNMVQTTESLSLSDTVSVAFNLVQLTEPLSLSDAAGIMSNNMVQLTEPLSLSDAAGIMSNNMVQLTEPLSISDAAGIMSNNMVQLTEPLSISDAAGIMSNNMVQLTEPLSLSDAAGIMSNNMVQLTEPLSLL